MHEGVTVKVLLDSGATRIFINKKMAQKHGFKMMKLEKPLRVKNVDRTENSRGKITLKGCKRELHTGTNKTMLCQLPIAC